MKQRGFTVIEIIVITTFIFAAAMLFIVQTNNIQVANRDSRRKTAINAMYYSLEENFYAINKFYPSQISEKNLTTMDAALFTDPNGVKLGQTSQTIDDQTVSVQSDYRYEAVGCTNDQCKGYTLRAALENEADFIKKSRNN
ncbi:MAG: type II secretion system protein [Candidatus Saccharibacteria bacterium]